MLDRTLSVAPMIDRTDRHCRYLLRLVSRRTLLYTEMITANAIVYGDAAHLLAFDPAEHPVALQLGGSDPAMMATAARVGAERGYDEINMNVGCPSDRVRSGSFGACLMAEPGAVAACVRAMKEAVSVPVTVKTRIGIDDQDSYGFLADFTGAVVEAGVDALIVHARKAWLHGLSPKENREIPPLDYERVYRLKHDWPDLPVVINGGIESLDAVAGHLHHVDGCMLGRAPYRDPWLLADADRRFHGTEPPYATRHEVVQAYRSYVAARLAEGVPLHHMTRHLSGLFQGRPGARAWRRALTEGAARGGGIEVIDDALCRVPNAVLETGSVSAATA